LIENQSMGERSQLGQKICFPFFSCLRRFLLKIFRFKCVSHITLLSLFLFYFLFANKRVVTIFRSTFFGSKFYMKGAKLDKSCMRLDNAIWSHSDPQYSWNFF
jgi:hypothetical protein